METIRRDSGIENLAPAPNVNFTVDQKAEGLAEPVPTRNLDLNNQDFLKPDKVKYYSMRVEKTKFSNLNPVKSQSVRIGNNKRMEDKAQRLEAMRAKFGQAMPIPGVKEKKNEDDSDAENSEDETDLSRQEQMQRKVKKLADEAYKKSFKYQKKNPKQVIDEANTVAEHDSDEDRKRQKNDDRDSETPEAEDMEDRITIDRCTNPMSMLMDNCQDRKPSEAQADGEEMMYQEGGMEAADEFEKQLTDALETEPVFEFDDEEDA